MWNDNDKIIEIVEKVENGIYTCPCICPACNEKTAHVYFHKHNEQHCGIWTWCSNCKASSHMSGAAPQWWENPNFIDSLKLCGNPEYLESMKDKIDEWVNSIAIKGDSKSDTPFVMENSFNVVLKENLQDIPAGSTGIIVIKDDFKTMIIDFIFANGKRVNITKSPEELRKIVEVIK